MEDEMSTNQYYGELFGSEMTPEIIIKQAGTFDENKLAEWLKQEYHEIAIINDEWEQYESDYDIYDWRTFARQVLSEIVFVNNKMINRNID